MERTISISWLGKERNDRVYIVGESEVARGEIPDVFPENSGDYQRVQIAYSGGMRKEAERILGFIEDMFGGMAVMCPYGMLEGMFKPDAEPDAEEKWQMHTSIDGALIREQLNENPFNSNN